MISVLTIGSMFWSIQTNQRDLSNIWHLKIAKILLRHKERLWNVSVGSEQDEDGVVMVIEGDGGWSLMAAIRVDARVRPRLGRRLEWLQPLERFSEDSVGDTSRDPLLLQIMSWIDFCHNESIFKYFPPACAGISSRWQQCSRLPEERSHLRISLSGGRTPQRRALPGLCTEWGGSSLRHTACLPWNPPGISGYKIWYICLYLTQNKLLI